MLMKFAILTVHLELETRGLLIDTRWIKPEISEQLVPEMNWLWIHQEVTPITVVERVAMQTQEVIRPETMAKMVLIQEFIQRREMMLLVH